MNMTEQENTKVNDINVDEIYYKNFEFIKILHTSRV